MDSRIQVERDGPLVNVTLALGRGNILDSAAMDALREFIESVGPDRTVRGVCLGADGPDFSFGASVEEHEPGRVAAMLNSFHGLVRAWVHAHVPTVAVVRGRCLGGGLELASLCHWIVASPAAVFGQPEISLGVFAPAASVILPWKIGGARAEDLLLSGRSIGAEEAREWGLVLEVADDPDQAARDFLDEHVLGKSGTALRIASRAARQGLVEGVGERLDEIENLYLEELMSTHDAAEGIRAFMERRPPEWGDR